ncbi:MAG TPA: TlyA family RNA methyltransferase [Dissulfurispiraceae bacterium]|nr:TlyA family RNA methyltransferase [Dissulfurispiraceae bacterium]
MSQRDKQRLDKVLVDRGLVASRERARALIMEGKVSVRGVPALKAGALVLPGDDVQLKGDDIPYVSRGGLKLEAALHFFGISLSGRVAMDVGSSTGGFTDCMLQGGVRRVYCIDVGYGQLAWKLRNDPRVILLERTNIRLLPRESISEPIDIATIDVSFISLGKVIPRVLEFLGSSGEILALVKPQFEVGKGEVGKGGIVRDEEKRLEAVDAVMKGLALLPLRSAGVFLCPVPGQKGNREYFIHLLKECGSTASEEPAD